jgi:hypothetical protein
VAQYTFKFSPGRGIRKYRDHLAREAEQLLRRSDSDGVRFRAGDELDKQIDALFTGSLPEDELEIVRARLMAEQTMLYGDYDRLRAESEFRVAIFIPLMVLILILAVGVHWLWALASVIPALLIVQAFQLESQAYFALLAAVTSGKVRSPFVEQLTNELAAHREQQREQQRDQAKREADARKRRMDEERLRESSVTTKLDGLDLVERAAPDRSL